MREEIIELRKATRLNASRFSRALGCSHTSIRNWENGFSMPSPMAKEKIIKLAKKIEREKGKEGLSL